MRRIFIWVTALALLCTLAVGAQAAVTAPKVGVFATVSQNGSCQVAATVNLHITEKTEGLTFPVPLEASGVTVNGSGATTYKDGNVRHIKLDRILKNVLGDVTLTVHYTLSDVVYATEAGTLELRLPLLSGFENPVNAVEFSVTLPGNVQGLPGFESGYHQHSIEQDLTYRVNGATITGNSLSMMKDHETLMLLLDVEEEMFPQTRKLSRNAGPAQIGMAVCGILALLYWVIFLFFLPLRRERCTEGPEDRTAGELGSVLHLQGIDLTLTVLSWARLGYVTVQPSRRGRVLIHRRMDMGNERKLVERRLFEMLFAKGDTVDTASARYARLRLETQKKTGPIQELLQKGSGNPMVFRGLAALMGALGGVAMAISVSGQPWELAVMILVLGGLGGITGWYAQLWGGSLVIWDPRNRNLSLAAAAVWPLLGLITKTFSLGLWMGVSMLAAGVLLAWGGHRTEQGKREVARVLGLRHYLGTVDKADLILICQNDPGYFFDLAPYALALGMDKALARQFRGIQLESCPYLMLEDDTQKTPAQWMHLLKQVVDGMDARARQLPWERMLAPLRNFRG